MPQKVWAVGEEALAADWNTYLQQQVVPTFTSTAQRDTQWVAPPRGALCVTTDTLTTWQFDGTAWGAVLMGTGAERVVASSIVTANRGGAIGTTEAVMGPTVAFTVVAGRQYFVRFMARFSASTATTGITRFRQSNLAGTAFGTFDFTIGGATTLGVSFLIPITGLPVGAFTLQPTMQTTAGTLTCTASTAQPSDFSVIER